MGTINFTQLPESVLSQDWTPNNDYLIGYSNVNNQPREYRYSLLTLAQETLPSSGIATRLHQVRKLATRTHLGSYSMAAITRREEVICWGKNKQESAPSGSGLSNSNLYTKFGAGLNNKVATKASVWQPMIIPFFTGTPSRTDFTTDIYDVKAAGLVIEELIWSEHFALALLSDKTVWFKGFVGDGQFCGFNTQITVDPKEAYFTSGFFKIDSFPAGTKIAKIGALPMPKPGYWGGLYYAVADNDGAINNGMSGPLYIWGQMPFKETNVKPRATYDPKFPGQVVPFDVTSAHTLFTNKRIMDVQLVGGGGSEKSTLPTRATLQVILDDGSLLSVGSNMFGNCGLGSSVKPAAEVDVWAEATYVPNFPRTSSTSIATVKVAQEFVKTLMQNNVCGFISKPNTDGDTGNVNRIYFSGTNIKTHNTKGSFGRVHQLVEVDGNTASAANNFFKCYAKSEPSNPFRKAILTNDLTCVAITQRGQVWSAGNGTSGCGGGSWVSPDVWLGTTFFKRTYKNKSLNSSSSFGADNCLSAVDLYFDPATFIGNCVGIKARNTVNKYDILFAGTNTFCNINQSFENAKDFSFRVFPLSDDFLPFEEQGDVVIGGSYTDHLWTLITTKSGRTYGVGAGDGDFLFNAETEDTSVPWSPVPQLLF